MTRHRLLVGAVAGMLCAATLPAPAAETIIVGAVGSPSTLYWPLYNEVELVFAGSTAARFAALQSGAIDATLVTAPFNFYAATAGFTELGLSADYVKDMPFLGAAVHKGWATDHQPAVRKFLSAFGKSVAWFQDERNRAEAISIMIAAGNMKPEDIERSYDFFRKGGYFEERNQVSKAQLGKAVDALRELGDIQGAFDVNRLIASDVAEVVD